MLIIKALFVVFGLYGIYKLAREGWAALFSEAEFDEIDYEADWRDYRNH